MTDELTADLTAAQLADAAQRGLTPEQYTGLLANEEWQAATNIGLTVEEFRELKRYAERGRATLEGWAAATNRDLSGRKVAK